MKKSFWLATIVLLFLISPVSSFADDPPTTGIYDPEVAEIIRGFRLSPDSPCIGAGTSEGLPEGGTDMLGNARRDPPSMGPIEYYNIGGEISPETIGGQHYKPSDH